MHQKGESAGGGTVFLRKVPTSDFYIEPFLRDKPESKKENVPNSTAATSPKPQTTKPQNKPPVTNKSVTKKPTVTKNQTTAKTQTVSKPKIPSKRLLQL